MKRSVVIVAAASLTTVIVLSFLVALYWSGSTQPKPREFYVGVEYAYGDQPNQVKALVDKVKDYTNLFILGSVELSFNRTALTETCDYIVDNNLNFIVFFTSSIDYDYSMPGVFNYTVFDWMREAQQRYGSQFLGIYRYDEPGGNQVDNGPNQIVNKTVVPISADYEYLANSYVGNLSVFPKYYLNYAPRIYTSDYALYWFDYKANYTTLFAEFVGNESRSRHIALCRAAADTFGKDWGVIVTWKYSDAPYLENGEELYSDLTLAYSSGAKYAVVFSYPDITAYGTLTEEHFEVLQRFWTILHTDPESFGLNTPEVAYVVPADYGFGFRNANDSIWGLFPADVLSAKIFNNVEALIERYDTHLNIYYDEPVALSQLNSFEKVYYWNQTVP